MEDTKLQQGKRYDWKKMYFAGWAGNDEIYDENGIRNAWIDGYNVADYFEDDGKYKGPDIHGVEPMFFDVIKVDANAQPN